jgi:hypothetical protein
MEIFGIELPATGYSWSNKWYTWAVQSTYLKQKTIVYNCDLYGADKIFEIQ